MNPILTRTDALVRALAESKRRKHEALAIYEPMQEQERFHASGAKERIIVGSNRAGKTLAPAVELARAVSASDPYAKFSPRNGRAIVVGYDYVHVARIMWSKLYRAGAFKMIRDKDTGSWRSYRPWVPEDLLRKHEVRRCASLIPHRLIDGQPAWISRKEDQPSLLRLKTGWEIWFYSSKADPAKGFDADLIWIDEEIENEHWYTEMLARLVDRGGRVIWSATPEGATERLYKIHERAEAAKEKGKKNVEEFFMTIKNNRHISQEDMEDFAAQLEDDPQAYRVKVLGEWAITSYKVFPDFSLAVHGCPYFDIPLDWARYAAIDPGTQITGILFAAVPPDEKHIYIYDELYIARCDAVKFAEQFSQRASSQVFETFFIDQKSAHYQEIGSGRTIQSQYAEELAKRHIISNTTGSNFLWGSTDKRGGLEAIRGWLRIRTDGTPTLKIFEGRLPNLCREMRNYHHKRDPKTKMPTDDTWDRHDHLIWGLRAFASAQIHYEKPVSKGRPRGLMKWLKERRKRRKLKEQAMASLGQGNFVQLGPPL